MLLVDAANVVGSRPTGWWRDRPGAARALVDRMQRAVADGSLGGHVDVVVVLEGEAKRGVTEGVRDGVEVVHAPGHGDDTIVALAAERGRSDDPVVLVSADRELGERVRAQAAEGAQCSEVVGPSWLLDRLPD